MNREQLLQTLTQRFAKSIIRVFDKSSRRVYIDIEAATLVEFAGYLCQELGARFNIASGVDAHHHMEILYHFTVENINLVISLRVTLVKSQLQISSLAPVIIAAHWIEREIHELLGIDFIGHPNLERLLLPENWPQNVHPLRKDFQEWDPNAVRDRGV